MNQSCIAGRRDQEIRRDHRARRCQLERARGEFWGAGTERRRQNYRGRLLVGWPSPVPGAATVFGMTRAPLQPVHALAHAQVCQSPGER